MSRLAELRLMTKVAHMYYDHGLRQPEIAERLDVSQATISRLLKRAEREGIVRITVSAPMGTFPVVEDALQARYGLKDVAVVDCEDEDELLRDLGAAAAFYVEATVKEEEVIGISSWSATLLAMVDAMRPLPRHMQAQVVQILGGVGNPAAEAHAARLSTRLASLVRGEARFLPAPGVLGSPDALDILLEDRFVQEALARFEYVTMALVGVGSLEPSKLLAASGNVFSDTELDWLRQSGAVGDICLRFFDSDGQPVNTPLDRRVISMRLEQLRQVRRSVGIAGGQRKRAAIRGALRGHWINVLITDRLTAEWLLEN